MQFLPETSLLIACNYCRYQVREAPIDSTNDQLIGDKGQGQKTLVAGVTTHCTVTDDVKTLRNAAVRPVL